ncbi:DNA polymerase III subunit delta' [Bacillus sp. FJAT-42376]|uniref:DNA polymerase III subunit delta' n=1 Tax=Bacillus sp. FJAT-42376 TaxID=2014076 RepID=UPI000F502B39|nr:DNA polymerase III subunit delta' [Bacillus sp. FJAT-42376]AZB41171.1 DNA polymerase III subunit delta' [Bacillus sp. FJAT-42376]
MDRTWKELESYQPRVLKLLENSLNKNRLAHAYLFEGKKGTGKKETAILLAKSFFCTSRKDAAPCGGCSSCRRIASGNHPDLHIIEPDGLSIKKHQIQSLQEEFSKKGLESAKKFYMILQADKMTANAANSLLKFLEEPGKDTIAVLTTEQVQMILNTIQSRCQVLPFSPLPAQIIRRELEKEGVIGYMAAAAAQMTNSLEDAIELSRNDWFAEARAIVIKLYEALTVRKEQAIVFVHTMWMPFFSDKDKQEQGLDLLLFLYKDLLSIQVGMEESIIYIDMKESLEKEALQTGQQRITEKVLSILETKRKLHSNANPQLLMEQLVLTLQEG